MPGEVYSTTKPAVPYRAWIAAICLLVLASALAADLVRRGAGSWSAGDLIQPQGWEMVFRPPAQFREVEADPERFGSVYVFRHTDREQRMLELTFWRTRADDMSAGQVARLILDQLKAKSWISLFLGPPPTRSAGRMGDREAVEFLDPPILLRALVLESGWSYAVTLRVEDGLLDESLYAIFEMTCRSVRFRKPAA